MGVRCGQVAIIALCSNCPVRIYKKCAQLSTVSRSHLPFWDGGWPDYLKLHSSGSSVKSQTSGRSTKTNCDHLQVSEE